MSGGVSPAELRLIRDAARCGCSDAALEAAARTTVGTVTKRSR